MSECPKCNGALEVSIGRHPIFGERFQPCECTGYKPEPPLLSMALDVSLERARALHRVWRALNDGDCPKCHTYRPASHMIRKNPFEPGHVIQCPECRFGVEIEEIGEIEKMFAPAMDAAVAIFEHWREERKEAAMRAEHNGESE